MNHETYDGIKFADDLREFEFISKGRYGPILKGVIFGLTEVPEVYNLSFGDLKKDGSIDDHSISDNGDRNKILATVVKIVGLYTDRYPQRWIYFKGSTEVRTRLYRMAIGTNLEELLEKFEIYGELNDTKVFYPFQKNMSVSSFLIKRKTIKFTI